MVGEMVQYEIYLLYVYEFEDLICVFEYIVKFDIEVYI